MFIGRTAGTLVTLVQKSPGCSQTGQTVDLMSTDRPRVSLPIEKRYFHIVVRLFTVSRILRHNGIRANRPFQGIRQLQRQRKGIRLKVYENRFQSSE